MRVNSFQFELWLIIYAVSFRVTWNITFEWLSTTSLVADFKKKISEYSTVGKAGTAGFIIPPAEHTQVLKKRFRVRQQRKGPHALWYSCWRYPGKVCNVSQMEPQRSRGELTYTGSEIEPWQAPALPSGELMFTHSFQKATTPNIQVLQSWNIQVW